MAPPTPLEPLPPVGTCTDTLPDAWIADSGNSSEAWSPPPLPPPLAAPGCAVDGGTVGGDDAARHDDDGATYLAASPARAAPCCCSASCSVGPPLGRKVVAGDDSDVVNSDLAALDECPCANDIVPEAPPGKCDMDREPSCGGESPCGRKLWAADARDVNDACFATFSWDTSRFSTVIVSVLATRNTSAAAGGEAATGWGEGE